MTAKRERKKASPVKVKVARPARLAATLVALGLSVVTASAQAISRYNPTAMSCAAIQATVAADGVAILRWVQPPNILRYDRFVAGNQYCGVEERVKTTTVPAADTAECPVYVCRHVEPLDFFFFFK